MGLLLTDFFRSQSLMLLFYIEADQLLAHISIGTDLNLIIYTEFRFLSLILLDVS